MDIDIYENVFQNATFNPNVTYDLHPNYYVEIPMAAVALLSAIADVLIVIVAIKFPLMHTRLYYYITSWCICNFLFVSVPVTMNLMGFEGVISATALCIWTVIYFALMLGNLIFVAVILVDWYIMTFNGQTRCALRCRRFHKVIQITVWIFLLLLFISAFLLCPKSISFPLVIVLFLIGYAAVFILTVTILLLRAIKLKTSSIMFDKGNLEMKIAVSFFFCWLPMLAYILFEFENSSVFASIEYLFLAIGYSSACVLLLLLYYYDKNFKACLRIFLNIDVHQIDGEPEESQNTFLLNN